MNRGCVTLPLEWTRTEPNLPPLPDGLACVAVIPDALRGCEFVVFEGKHLEQWEPGQEPYRYHSVQHLLDGWATMQDYHATGHLHRRGVELELEGPAACPACERPCPCGHGIWQHRQRFRDSYAPTGEAGACAWDGCACEQYAAVDAMGVAR